MTVNETMTAERMKQMIAMPLEFKILMTKQRIQSWLERWNGNCHVSFSGGKDSTVLLHIARSVLPGMKAVFCDTGLEYPEIREFVKRFENVDIIRPEMNFKVVLETYGYPVISKKVARYVHDLSNASDKNKNVCNLRITGYNREGKFCSSLRLSKKWKYLINAPFKTSDKCCDVMKKRPFHAYEKVTGTKPIIGIMSGDSEDRERAASRIGCFQLKEGKEQLRPIIFWTEEDIWAYIKQNHVPYSPIYDMGETRTGCIFCMFGAHLEKPYNRFQRMKFTHPQLWAYCMDKLGLREVLNYCKIPTGDNDLFVYNTNGKQS